MKTATFFGELKRRNILRSVTLYAAGTWALAQGIAQLAPAVGLPDWSTRWFLVAATIGLPFWLTFAWLYAFTPAGLKRESEIASEGSLVRHYSGRKLDLWIIGILALAVVLLVTNQFVMRRDATDVAAGNEAAAIAAALAKLPDKSVAVLPLANESGDPGQQYFSDGLSEELISDLTQIDGLKVIGKYSSFKFRDSKDSPAQIGAALGVAHLIEGSVRQQGKNIRVSVQLVRAADGVSVWAHTYDQRLEDIFLIQTQIGHAVASALQIKLLGHPIVPDDKPPSGNIEAYRLMLQGRALARRGTETDIREAAALLQQALDLDSDYAFASGVLSNTLLNLGAQFLTGEARQRVWSQARAAADKQQVLAPDAAVTHLDNGALFSLVDNNPKAALTEYRRAFALAPNDGTAMDFLAYGLQVVGQLQPAAELFRKAIATDPLRADFYSNLANVLMAQHDLDAADQATRKALSLQPDYPELYTQLALIDILRGDAAAAQRDAGAETDPVYGPWARALAQQLVQDRAQADAALNDYIQNDGAQQPYQVAGLYALRQESDAMFEWLKRAAAQHDPNFGNLLSDPLILRYADDPRFAALAKQAGLPLPGKLLPVAHSANGR